MYVGTAYAADHWNTEYWNTGTLEYWNTAYAAAYALVTK